MTFTLSESLAARADAKAKAAGFRSTAEFIESVVIDAVDDDEIIVPPDPARTPRNREELERMLDEGTASGEWIRADEAFWVERRRELHERHARDPNRKA